MHIFIRIFIPIASEGGTDTGSSTATVAASVTVVLVIIILVAVLVVMIVFVLVRRGKRSGSMDIYNNRPVSQSSKDIFFHMEETVVRRAYSITYMYT